MLEIKNLHASVEKTKILKGLNLKVNSGEIHAIMGPNGSGKSTLASVIAGRDDYDVTNGQIKFNGNNLSDLGPDERAREGIFLAFQYPVEIPGVTTTNFMKTAVNQIRHFKGEKPLDAVAFLKLMKEKMKLVNIKQDLLSRSINDGFSGGEKKRNEILQLSLLNPKLAILDETDSASLVFCSGSRPQLTHNALPFFITLTPLQYGHGSLTSVAPPSNMSIAFFVSSSGILLVKYLHKKI